jgi:hypothetical protein
MVRGKGQWNKIRCINCGKSFQAIQAGSVERVEGSSTGSEPFVGVSPSGPESWHPRKTHNIGPTGWFAVAIVIIVVIGVAVGLLSGSSNNSTPPANTPPPGGNAQPSPTLTIGMINDAGVEIHVWVYVSGSLAWEGYLGTGMLSSIASFDLNHGGDITTEFSLGYSTWHVCYGSVGDHIDIYYHLDGTTTYIKS